ncbi:MAG: oligosaccharide repeat unit polymerase family protein [Methanobacteriaceae archaeon]|jgi:oligosaccharide repeat unit polymerase|nr:MAG: oligosaccharide repeat unit polymerase [Methanobacterium sp. BRmetb2]MCC7557952.1 oligosaccharide repeat unit polymerase family protein [Methanobacteriaceae archaeon]
MSSIYNLSTKLSLKIKNLIENTFIFLILQKLFLYIEDLWLNSFFRQLYPDKFLNFLNDSYILKNHIFSPLIIIVAFAFFMILASIPISPSLQFNILIGFISFFIFSTIIPKAVLNDKKFIIFDSKKIYSLGLLLLIISFIFFYLNIITLGSLPLLDPSLRYVLDPKLTLPTFLSIPAVALMGSHILKEMQNDQLSKSSAKFRLISLSAISILLLFCLGYRTPLVALILIVVIMGYYTKLFQVWEIILGFLIILSVVMVLGYFRSVEEYALGYLSALDFLRSRAAFTLGVLDLLNHISGFFGFMHGNLALSILPGPGDGPRVIIGKLIAWRSSVTITPTLFGPMLVDFGTVGITVGMGFLGLITGAGYKILQKTKDSFYVALYAIILSYIIIGVETGILDQLVILYILVAAIIYFANILKKQNPC